MANSQMGVEVRNFEKIKNFLGIDKVGLFARMWKDYQASVQWKVSKEAGEND